MPDARKRCLEVLRRQQPCVGVHIGKNDVGAGHANSIRRCQKRQRRHDHGIPGTDPEGVDGEVQRRRAAVARNRVPGAGRHREGRFERLDRWTGRQIVTGQGPSHGIQVVLFDRLPAIGQKGTRGLHASIAPWHTYWRVACSGIGALATSDPDDRFSGRCLCTRRNRASEVQSDT